MYSYKISFPLDPIWRHYIMLERPRTVESPLSILDWIG